MNFCLPKEYTDKLLTALRNGEITPEKLNDFETSVERRDFLATYVGKENAKEVNSLIESKLLLKYWQRGMITAMEQLTGMKPEVKRDLVTKIEKLDKYLNAKEQKQFMADIASKKIGAEVTYEEAQKIVELTSDVKKRRETFEEDPTEDNRIAMGMAMIDLIEGVKTINPGDSNIVAELINLPRAAMSTFDFSAPLRQGWGLMTQKDFWKSLPFMFKVLNDRGMKGLQADIITNPHYELAKKAGLRISILPKDITQREEDYTSKILEKVPGLGTLFKGSEYAYTGFLSKVRMDYFSQLVTAAELTGEDVSMNSKTIKDIAEVVNNFSGSGNVGAGDKYSGAVPFLNAIFFAPRKIAGMLNMFNPVRYLPRETINKVLPKNYQLETVSLTAQKAAFRNLIGSVLATGAVLSLVKLLRPDDEDRIEEDPRSSDFGKVRIGNIRYDISGGNAGYITLISRLLTQETKSTTTDAVTKLGEGYKATTGKDLIINFTTNKLSPVASLAMALASQKDFNGKPIVLSKEIVNRVTPLMIQDMIKIAKEDKGQIIPALILGTFGAGIGAYQNTNTRDSVIKETYDKYKTGSIDRAIKEIETKLEKEEGKKLSPAQKTNIKKQYGVYRKFGNDSDTLDKAMEIFEAKTNDDKVIILNELKKKDRAMYNTLLTKGRLSIITDKGNSTPVLISDDLLDKLKK